jgi:hypothetical protein
LRINKKCIVADEETSYSQPLHRYIHAPGPPGS